VDLSSQCCLLSWAEPSIMNAAIISLAVPHLCIMMGKFHPLDLTCVITLIAIPDGLVDNTAKLDSLTQSTRWSHWTSLLYVLLFANGRRTLSGSIQSGIRLSSGREGKGWIFHGYGQKFLGLYIIVEQLYSYLHLQKVRLSLIYILLHRLWYFLLYFWTQFSFVISFYLDFIFILLLFYFYEK
jgi:hypothetical protein